MPRKIKAGSLNHSITLNNRINRIHERCLRIVYKDSHLTFDATLRMHNSFTIHHRNLQKLAMEMYKIYNNLWPSIMRSIFPEMSIPYDLRYKNPYLSKSVHTVFNRSETIYFRGPKTWKLVPEDIKCSKTLAEFKTTIRNWEPKGCTCTICKTYVCTLGFL